MTTAERNRIETKERLEAYEDFKQKVIENFNEECEEGKHVYGKLRVISVDDKQFAIANKLTFPGDTFKMPVIVQCNCDDNITFVCDLEDIIKGTINQCAICDSSTEARDWYFGRNHEDSYSKIGDKYGNLTIIGVDYDKTKSTTLSRKDGWLKTYYICQCDCGRLRTMEWKEIRRTDENKQRCITCNKEIFSQRKVTIKFKTEEGVTTITTSKGEEIKIDNEDFSRIFPFVYNVKINNYGFPVVDISDKTFYLNRLVLWRTKATEDNVIIEHADGDRLNVMKENLIYVDKTVNPSVAASKVSEGVTLDTKSGIQKYTASTHKAGYPLCTVNNIQDSDTAIKIKEILDNKLSQNVSELEMYSLVQKLQEDIDNNNFDVNNYK